MARLSMGRPPQGYKSREKLTLYSSDGTLPSKIPLPTTGVGDEHTPQKSMPVMKAAAGQVMIQPPKMIAQLFQLTDCVLPVSYTHLRAHET